MFYLKDVRYKDILDIAELSIEEKKITCIVGKSGGGKTTLLKLLNNMISSDSGLIKFNNKKIDKYDPIILRRQVLMLPQNPVVFPETVLDNFITSLQFAGKEEMNIDYEKILKKVNLNLSLNDKVENLSGGEKQRLALARVLMLEPEVLLLDEPSSALDENTEELIIKMVVDFVHEQKKTLVMVTHSNKIAQKFGHKIVVINQGKIDDVVIKEDE